MKLERGARLGLLVGLLVDERLGMFVADDERLGLFVADVEMLGLFAVATEWVERRGSFAAAMATLAAAIASSLRACVICSNPCMCWHE